MPVDVEDLIDQIGAVAAGKRRVLIGLAGPPGAGKSTLAADLAHRVSLGANRSRAMVVPMDGFHYDDSILEASGLLPRKGAPETFDVDGFAVLLQRLKADPPVAVAIPVFDRDLELSRGSARIVPADTQILLIEGNYLLLQEPPWQDLHTLFDLTVMLSVPEPVLRTRLIDRWLYYGHDRETACAKADGNDMPNVRTVIARSRAADVVVKTDTGPS